MPADRMGWVAYVAVCLTLLGGLEVRYWNDYAMVDAVFTSTIARVSPWSSLLYASLVTGLFIALRVSRGGWPLRLGVGGLVLGGWFLTHPVQAYDGTYRLTHGFGGTIAFADVGLGPGRSDHRVCPCADLRWGWVELACEDGSVRLAHGWYPFHVDSAVEARLCEGGAPR